MLGDLPVGEVLVADVVTIDATASVATAAERLSNADVGSLVVLDGAGDPVGIITNSDVVDLVAAGVEPTEATVADRMSTPLVTIGPDASLEDAARRLLDNDVKRLPVVSEDTLQGIVTVTDLSYYLPSIALGPREHRRLPASRPELSYDTADWSAEIAAGDEPDVGDTVRFTKHLSEDDVVDFARASGDTNRIHLDDGFAIGSRFGERIVHGTLVAGVISAALARLPGLVIYLSQDLQFRAPVPVGAAVTAVCEVTASLGGNRFRVSTAVYREDEVVVDGEATVLVDELHEATPVPRADVAR